MRVETRVETRVEKGVETEINDFRVPLVYG